jgi:hypothetical protein
MLKAASRSLALIVALLAASPDAWSKSAKSIVEQGPVDPRVRDLIARSTRAEVIRLHREDQSPPIYLAGDRKALTAELRSRFSALLSNDDSYLVRTRELPDGSVVLSVKGCLMVPGMAVRFFGTRRSEQVDVFLCFLCGQVGFSKSARLAYTEGKQFRLPRSEIADLGDGFLPLLALATEVFPEDEELQKLLAARQARGAQPAR